MRSGRIEAGLGTWFWLLGWAMIGPVPAAAQVGTPTFSLGTLRDRCIEFAQVKPGPAIEDYRECRVSEFGEVGVVGTETYYYALNCLIPGGGTPDGKCGDDSFVARYHQAGAVAVFSRGSTTDTVRLVLERADPERLVRYEPPRIIHRPVGTLLVLPIAGDGTGNLNASEYFLWDSGQWERLETDGWLKELGKRLPDGLAIWKGVWPDLRTMRAEAGLYRLGDANCCPTGGVARIHLSIRGRHFVLDSLVIDRSP